jgi:hypothetical protein
VSAAASTAAGPPSGEPSQDAEGRRRRLRLDRSRISKFTPSRTESPFCSCRGYLHLSRRQQFFGPSFVHRLSLLVSRILSCMCNLNSNPFFIILLVNPTPVTLELRFDSKHGFRGGFGRRGSWLRANFLHRLGERTEFFRHRERFLVTSLQYLFCSVTGQDRSFNFLFVCCNYIWLWPPTSKIFHCTREYKSIKLVNWDTCVSFRVSAPEYHRIRILLKHQCRKILAPLLSRFSGRADSFPYPAQD